MNEKDILNKLKYIQIDVEKLLELHNGIYENYFAYRIDCEGLQISHPDKDNELRAYKHCKNKHKYTVLADIADDYIRKILTDIGEIIERGYAQ